MNQEAEMKKKVYTAPALKKLSARVKLTVPITYPVTVKE